MDSIEARLDTLAEQGLKRTRRLLDSAQGARITLDGRDCLSFASNDYLGLAAHPSGRSGVVTASELHPLRARLLLLRAGLNQTSTSEKPAPLIDCCFCNLQRVILPATGRNVEAVR